MVVVGGGKEEEKGNEEADEGRVRKRKGRRWKSLLIKYSHV